MSPLNTFNVTEQKREYKIHFRLAERKQDPEVMTLPHIILFLRKHEKSSVNKCHYHITTIPNTVNTIQLNSNIS